MTRTQGNNEALKDGSVRPDGHEFVFTEVPVLVTAFRQMVRDLEFDVCEMAVTTYLCARAHGKAFTALPVFLVRGFHHGALVRATGSGVTPDGLEGRRVGVNRGYTVTTGVWARGILQDEYGVDPDRVTWLPTGDEHVAEYRPPANVTPLDAGLDTALADGRIDAAVGIEATHPALEPLIPDPEEAGFAALRERGLYPINHLVVVKDELLRADPGLAVAVFDAFAAAKRRYVDRLATGAIVAPTATDLMYRQVMQITGADPLPYGIAPNRAMLEQLIGHAVRQHILDRPPAVEDLFHPTTHELSA
ncbi:ABC transporter substrate-binding protein [Dactylosporangium sp. NPDC005572]|uniref:ABC transporter substrate-binding protein n=1 Tax=Dactylosporangium sp. NPDC005572 TaxID=3156889 RepID=UPI0033A15792